MITCSAVKVGKGLYFSEAPIVGLVLGLVEMAVAVAVAVVFAHVVV